MLMKVLVCEYTITSRVLCHVIRRYYRQFKLRRDLVRDLIMMEVKENAQSLQLKGELLLNVGQVVTATSLVPCKGLLERSCFFEYFQLVIYFF